jgi:hypothetical protein
MKNNYYLLAMIIMALSLALCGEARASDDSLWTNESPMTKFIARHYDVDPIVVISLGQRMTLPDDVSVALYLAKTADMSPLKLLEPRLKKKSWPDIAARLRFEPALLFIPLDGKEKIPEEFRHAYGEYAKHLKNPNYAMVLYDKEYRNLVQLRLMVDAFKFSPLAVMESVSRGARFTDLILEQLKAQEDE